MRKNNYEMKPLNCPFCNGKVKIGIYDDEGNLHNEEYEKNPYSGLWYAIQHFYRDVPKRLEGCFLASWDSTFYEEHIGRRFATKEGLLKYWNMRSLKNERRK